MCTHLELLLLESMHIQLGELWLCICNALRRAALRADTMAEHTVFLDDEILARIRAAKVWDKNSRLEDFQIRAYENGSVLINIKTGQAQLLYDHDSELPDWNELFPTLILMPKRSHD